MPWRHGLLGHPGRTRRGTTRPFSELLERSGKDLDQERNTRFRKSEMREKNDGVFGNGRENWILPCLTVCLLLRMSWTVAEIFQ